MTRTKSVFFYLSTTGLPTFFLYYRPLLLDVVQTELYFSHQKSTIAPCGSVASCGSLLFTDANLCNARNRIPRQIYKLNNEKTNACTTSSMLPTRGSVLFRIVCCSQTTRKRKSRDREAPPSTDKRRAKREFLLRYFLPT